MKTLAFGKISGREVYIYVSSSKLAPDDDEWNSYLSFLRKNLKRGIPTMSIVQTDGPPPTAIQRKKMSETVEHMGKILRVAILTSSSVVRGVVTALSWVGINYVAFAPDRLDEALAQFHIEGADAMEARAMISKFKQDLA